MGNKDLRERHWQKIFNHIGYELPSQYFTFNDLIPFDILKQKDFIDELSLKASGEAVVETQIENIKLKWDELSFVVLPYGDIKGRYKITGIDEIVTNLDDHQSSIQAILGTQYAEFIRKDVENWEKQLLLIGEILDEWLTC